MSNCRHCAAEELINSYGGLAEAKDYMKRYFKLNGGLRNKYPKTGSLITSKMNELQSAISIVEGGNNGQ
ncbi:hypothetical protein DIW83_05800 [Acinetobacter nosocomialis]|uniref:hypothetical protein n=1 Tax=Acinetobacter nosocomialis TaxID=106654 RepID=UPI000316F35B|nr:hypothetical protein [Acinetobacter nosocomialis]AWL18575.1 hypothetical protein DIW83_05800 [Acinetobacter nosocomialis]